MREEGFLIAFQLYDSTIFNSLKAENQTKCYGWAEVLGMWPNLKVKRQSIRIIGDSGGVWETSQDVELGYLGLNSGSTMSHETS